MCVRVHVVAMGQKLVREWRKSEEEREFLEVTENDARYLRDQFDAIKLKYGQGVDRSSLHRDFNHLCSQFSEMDADISKNQHWVDEPLNELLKTTYTSRQQTADTLGINKIKRPTLE